MIKTMLTKYGTRLYAAIAVIAIVFVFMIAGFIGTLAADSRDSKYQLSPLSYDIQARWEQETNTLQATAEVTFTNSYPDALSELVFHWHGDSTSNVATQTQQARSVNEQWAKSLGADHPMPESDWLGGIKTKSVTTKNGDALVFEHQAQALTIKLPKPLNTGDSITIKINYGVEYPYGANLLMRSESITGGTWWTPQLAVYDPLYHAWNRTPYDANYRSDFYSMADYNVKLELPAEWNVITNGDHTHTSIKEDKQIVSTVAHGVREMVWYGGDLEEVGSIKLDSGLIIRLYRQDSSAVRHDGLQPLSTEAGQQLLSQAAAAAEWMTEKIGRLPYPEIKLVEAPYTGITQSMDGIMMFSRKQDGTIDESSIYRMLASQWVQHAVGSNPQTDGFLSTGLSEYMASRYTEEVLQKPWSSPDMKQMVPQTLPAAAPAQKLGPEAELHYRLYGSSALHQWTSQFGTEAFDQALQQFYDRYKGKMASTKGFINIVQQTCGEDAAQALSKLLF
ncbi:hypothetical protein [Paenibacillus marinisediminis]